MKKVISIIMAAIVTAGMVSCSDGGSGTLPLFSGGSEVTDGTAPMKYMEYMYNNENGRQLSDQAMGGVPVSDELTTKVGEYLKVPVIEYLGQSNENPASANWWEKMDISADKLDTYMSSPDGRQKLNEYISGSKSSNSISAGGINVSGPRKAEIIYLTSEMFKSFNSISTISSRTNNIEDTGWLNLLIIQHLMAQVNQINQQLNDLRDSIQAGFEQTNYRLDIIENWLLSQDLRDVNLLVNSKITDFSTLASIGMWQQRRNEMNEFFGPNSDYQYHFDRAFDSALQRAVCLNKRADSASYKPVPGNMLYSDMIFMRKMSELRLSNSSVFLTGHDLINYRGVKAQEDLKKVMQLKEAFLSDTTPDRDIAYFNDVMALLVSWEIVLRAHIELYDGRHIASTNLENARHESFGFGTFGDLDGDNNTGTVGRMLTNNAGLTIASLLDNGYAMESMFDSSTSGPLASGKYLRIMVGGKNIMTGIGPNNVVLKPVYKDMYNEILPPPANQCYVDPRNGRFVLPRPLYWSRLESLANISNPEIGVIEYKPESSLSGSFDADGPVGMMFSGNGIYCANSLVNANFGNATKDGTRSIKPFGNHALNFSKGTVSAWVKMHTYATLYLYHSDAECNARLYLVDAPGFKVYIDSYLHTTWGAGPVMLNYNINGNTGYFQMPDNQNCHVYVVWDNENGLGGNSLRIFVDGVNVLSSSASLPDLSSLVYGLSYRAYVWTYIIDTGATAESNVYLDNLKIFNHVVTEIPSSQPNPSWEYNSGAGRENAIHAVYGPDSNPAYDYMPKITGAGNGVGYYYRLP